MGQPDRESESEYSDKMKTWKKPADGSGDCKNTGWKSWQNLRKSYGWENLSQAEEEEVGDDGPAGGLLPRLPPPPPQGGEGEEQRSGRHHKRSLSLSLKASQKVNFTFNRVALIISKFKALFKALLFCSKWLACSFGQATTPTPLLQRYSSAIWSLKFNCFQKLIWFSKHNCWVRPNICSANPDWKVPVERGGLGLALDWRLD